MRPDNITASRLNARFGHAQAEVVLAVALDRYEGRIALTSSFGAEAAVLLHMLAKIDPGVPVLMVDTELLFPETLAYQTELVQRFGLTDLRRITPDPGDDPDKTLHLRDTTACCGLRKTAPLQRALQGFGAVINGRKRHQTRDRAQLQCFEIGPDGRLKVNPLANWGPDQTAAYFQVHDLPRHPLVARGYPSIGCAPCTSPVAPGEDSRAGRWRHEARQECGIHFRADGTVERTA